MSKKLHEEVVKMLWLYSNQVGRNVRDAEANRTKWIPLENEMIKKFGGEIVGRRYITDKINITARSMKLGIRMARRYALLAMQDNLFEYNPFDYESEEE